MDRPEPPQTNPTLGFAGLLRPTTRFVDLDRAWHAKQARLTSGLSPAALWLAFADWGLHLANAPFRRVDLATDALHQYGRWLDAVLGQRMIEPSPGDHRFASPAWQLPPFSVAQQGFLLAEEWWDRASHAGPAIDEHNTKLVSFTLRQLLDIASPSNIPWINPEVRAETWRTSGSNLVAGTRNLLHDLQTGLADKPQAEQGFTVGGNLAATPGKVVFRNELIELLQYTPTTATVRPEPVLIVPAWIMKYYILDLSPHNSMIRYLVEQGHTVFAISWRNPTAEQRDLSLDDYRRLGPIAALDAVSEICGNAKVHAAGYCLGGTLLAITAAAMARDEDNRLASVTLMAAQTDFTEAGELQLFISDGQIAFLEDVMNTNGTLDSRQMAGAFEMLHSRDLVWSRMIDSYMLGRVEGGFDLMAWNADGTRMPARMHSEYLRQLFLHNDLAEGRYRVGDRPVALSDIDVPFFVVGTETDHIAPWRSVTKIHLLNAGEITFVLTAGGHNAGIVSEPGHPHRSFRMLTRGAMGHTLGPDEWAATAPRHDGSWWTNWCQWLNAHSGPAQPPPPMGIGADLPDAPGSYVLEH
jgi:polyhydroxyalkanoate synthase